jgi:SRSO17 transposase
VFLRKWDFAPNPQLARQMLQCAFQACLPIKLVTADSVYVSNHRLRMWLEKEKHAYALGVSAQESVCIGWETERVRVLVAKT